MKALVYTILTIMFVAILYTIYLFFWKDVITNQQEHNVVQPTQTTQPTPTVEQPQPTVEPTEQTQTVIEAGFTVSTVNHLNCESVKTAEAAFIIDCIKATNITNKEDAPDVIEQCAATADDTLCIHDYYYQYCKGNVCYNKDEMQLNFPNVTGVN